MAPSVPDEDFGIPNALSIPVATLSDIAITLRFSLTAGDSASLTSLFNVEPIPEPGTAILLAVGLAGLARMGRPRAWTRSRSMSEGTFPSFTSGERAFVVLAGCGKTPDRAGRRDRGRSQGAKAQPSRRYGELSQRSERPRDRCPSDGRVFPQPASSTPAT